MSLPCSLIGKHVEHKLEHEGTHESEWYCDSAVGYDPLTKLFEIAYMYNGEEDTCTFDIIILGDLVVVL